MTSNAKCIIAASVAGASLTAAACVAGLAHGQPTLPTVNGGKALVCNQYPRDWREVPNRRPCATVRVFEDGTARIVVRTPAGTRHEAAVGNGAL